MTQNEIQGRFDVVFKSLEEFQAEEAESESSQDSIQENEAIDELRRLSVEFAEAPRLSFTTTSAPVLTETQATFAVLGIDRRLPASS